MRAAEAGRVDGPTRDVLRAFPDEPRRVLGYAIYLAQLGRRGGARDGRQRGRKLLAGAPLLNRKGERHRDGGCQDADAR
jgi:hypothetical protein